MNIRSLDQAPTPNDYLTGVQAEEESRDFRPATADQLLLTPAGLLNVGGKPFELSDDAATDLAKLARIPTAYFSDISPDLQAINFNARLTHFCGPDETLEVIISNDNAVQRIQRPRFGRISVPLVIEALLDTVAADTVSNDIRVIEYDRERRVDLALISRALQAEPRGGDIVCGGVHLTIEENGAVQVGPESFRLVCRNGAMARVCAGGKHRLRRGTGRDSDRKFLATLREFGRIAWQDWQLVKNGLEALALQKFDAADIGQIMNGLRRRPFFISARAASRVADQLRANGDDLTFYDLHNAITYVGSHDGDVLPQYRYRLRLGAGQLARGRAGVCRECRQLMIGMRPSEN